MWVSRETLQICYTLKNHGLSFDFKPGVHLGRGFADLGYEEFCLLPGNKIISLINGKIADLPLEEQKHFYVIPTNQQVINKIDLLGFDIVSLIYEDRREWEIYLRNAKTEHHIKDRSLDLVLLKALEFAFVNKEVCH